ncbi:alpha/beta fold hydrolase [Virgibacillus halodenitrificans]|uniref:alpha/beta fold hydrolase n=1 Tax=Virgibacillus halodenitrificans TaxID=1482 RepID=UPI000761D0EC
MEEKNYKQKHIQLPSGETYAEYVLNDKPPILLLHGFVSSTYTFHQLMPLLKEKFSVIAIDLIGFGKSEKSTSFIYSYANYAKLIKECMDYFDIKKISIAGHSMGGQIALYTAKQYPEKIDRLVLLASSGYLPRAKKRLIFVSYLPFFHLFARRHVQKQGVASTLKNVLYNQEYITPELIDAYGAPLKEKNFYKALIRLLRYREGDLNQEALNQIKQPTLLIWGKEDKVVSLRVGMQLEKDLPHATLISYPDTGHLVTEERPEEVYRDIISFIKH